MASTEAPSGQPSDGPVLEKRDDENDDPSMASSIQHDEPDGKPNGKQGAETKLAPSVLLAQDQNPEPVWAHGFQLWTIMVAVTLVTFLMLLDGTIVVAAVPRITDDFHSLNDIGWYGAAYQLGRSVRDSISKRIGYHE